MARKWSNLNLPGALHFVTGNVLNRTKILTDSTLCTAFLDELHSLNLKWPSKLIAYVLMPDHFHLICNPRWAHQGIHRSAKKPLGKTHHQGLKVFRAQW